MNQASPLDISRITFFPVKLDFRIGVAHSLASRDFSVNVVVCAESSSGASGYGECVPREYVTGESTESVSTYLRDTIRSVEGVSFHSPEELTGFLEKIGTSDEGMSNPAAVCALELALIDLAGHHWKKSALEIVGLSANDKSIVYSLVIPILPEKILESFLHQAKMFSFPHVKVKIDGESHITRVKKVREHLGDAIQIRVDANGALDPDSMQSIAGDLKSLGVVAVEQPFRTDQLAESGHFRSLGLLDIVLDESVANSKDVQRAADAGACDIANVRISKCGGYLGALRVIKASRQNGIRVQLGAQVGESCILSSAGVHLASAMDDFIWLEGCFGRHLLVDDLCDESLQFGPGGATTAPYGYGFGVCVSPERLSRAHRAYRDM